MENLIPLIFVAAIIAVFWIIVLVTESSLYIRDAKHAARISSRGKHAFRKELKHALWVIKEAAKRRETECEILRMEEWGDEMVAELTKRGFLAYVNVTWYGTTQVVVQW